MIHQQSVTVKPAVPAIAETIFDKEEFSLTALLADLEVLASVGERLQRVAAGCQFLFATAFQLLEIYAAEG